MKREQPLLEVYLGSERGESKVGIRKQDYTATRSTMIYVRFV